MNFKDLKQWEQLDREIEFWKNAVKNLNGVMSNYVKFPLCKQYDSRGSLGCSGCPLLNFIGQNCNKGTPFDKWMDSKTPETAQAMVDRLVEIRNKLHRLDR